MVASAIDPKRAPPRWSWYDRIVTQPVTDLATLLRSLRPVLHPGAFVFATLPNGVDVDAASVIASVREAEGLSVVVSEVDAQRLGLPYAFLSAWITLSVQSDLEAVGLTAAVSTALADAGISCNVVAGMCHDHLFVPFERADDAMTILRQLSR